MSKTTMDARCGACDHVWPVVELPMEVSQLSRTLRAAHCPSCGAGSRMMFMYQEPQSFAPMAEEREHQLALNAQTSCAHLE